MVMAPAFHCRPNKPEPWTSGNVGKGRGGRPWRRKRETVFRRDKKLCVPCLKSGRYTPATEVDHIKELSRGGTDNLSNLQSICTQCHKAKTGMGGQNV